MSRSKILRLAIPVLLLLLVGVVLFIRANLVLPFYDGVRFQHWRYGDERTALADALWAEPDFNDLHRSFDGERIEVHALTGDFSTDDFSSTVLSGEKAARFNRLLGDARIASITRGETSLGVSLQLGTTKRFGRDIHLRLESPRNGYEHARQCDGQIHIEEQGSCEIALDSNWVLFYWWNPPYEDWQAKCAGILRAYADEIEDQEAANYYLRDSEQRLSGASDDLGEEDARLLAAAGEEELRAARSEGRSDSVEGLVLDCDY